VVLSFKIENLMRMHAIIYRALLSLCLSFFLAYERISGQTEAELNVRIWEKFRKDHLYSNLYSSFLSDHLRGMRLAKEDGTGIEIVTPTGVGQSSRTAVSYRIISLPNGIGEKSPLPLFIIMETSVVDPISGREKRTSELVFDVRDFLNLRVKDPQNYRAIVEDLKISSRERLRKDFGINYRRRAVSPGNEDYLNYAILHAAHAYSILPETSSIWVGTVRTSGPTSDTTAYYVDGCLNVWKPVPSRISFSHKLLSSAEWLGILGFGLEVGLSEDQLLGFLPTQAPYWSGGFRFLFNFTGDRSDLVKHTFLDLKVLLRKSRGGWKGLLNWVNSAAPFFILPQPKLNVSSGGAIYLSTSKLWLFDWPELPPVTLYLSGSSSNFQEPSYLFGDPGRRYAYFSQWQGELTFSFYWNTNTRSGYYTGEGTLLNQFRLDLGLGGYDIWRLSYDSSNAVNCKTKEISLEGLKPVFALEYTHASSNAKFGAKVRFFDNRIALTTWIKVLSVRDHQLRVERMSVSEPKWRSHKEWETEGGSLLQLRYRYGL